jgi:uncharacterized protein (DUF849 family)
VWRKEQEHRRLAAEAGAAVVHIHVRHPDTGKPSMELDHYSEVMHLIKAQNKELIINLTTGPGGRFIPSEDDPKVFAAGTTLCHPLKRVEHVAKLKPDICSLDLNTMNSGADVVINTPANVRKMAQVIKEAGVMPELEIFDTGDLNLAKDLIKEGVLEGPGLYTFVMGVKYGLNTDPATLLYMRDQLPQGAKWAAFGIAKAEFPIVAQAWLYGGHVRVGMEDNIYLDRGVLCESNAQLVSRANRIIKDLGGELATSREAREILDLKK